MTELAGRLAVVKVSGSPADLSTEGLTRITDTEWQISTATKQVLERGSVITLERNDGGWADITYLSVNRLNGVFTFAGAGYVAGSTIRVKTTAPTANYLPVSTAAYAHDYTYARGVDMHEVTAFLATHKKRIAGTKYGAGTLSQWDILSVYYKDALTAGEPVVLEFRGSAAGDPQRLWALLESSEIQAAVDSPQDEVVSFVSTDDLLNL